MKNILTNNKKNLMTYGIVTVAFIIMQFLSSMGMLKSSVNGYLVPELHCSGSVLEPAGWCLR